MDLSVQLEVNMVLSVDQNIDMGLEVELDIYGPHCRAGDEGT